MAADTHQNESGGTPEDLRRTQLLEQYKAYLTDVGNIGTRYTTANAFYISIISALLAILALAKKEEALERFDSILYITVPIFAILLCFVWRDTIDFYGATFKMKFAILREMEEELPFAIFAREEQLRQPGRRITTNERWIPFILAIPFAVLLIYGISQVIRISPAGMH